MDFRVGRFLTDIVKTYGLNRHVKNRFLMPKCQKCQLPPPTPLPTPRNIVKNWMIGPKLSFLNILYIETICSVVLKCTFEVILDLLLLKTKVT